METAAVPHGRRVAAQVMDEARRHFRKPIALVAALEREGIVSPKSGERYSESVVSAWARGAAGVPAEVLITTARLANISIDSYYLGTTRAGEGESDEATVRRLQGEIEARDAATNARIDHVLQRLDRITELLEGDQGGEDRGVSAS